MVGRSDRGQRTADEPGGTKADDAEAEERATDEGMPEPPVSATSEEALPDGPVSLDDFEEDDGGHDLGGEA